MDRHHTRALLRDSGLAPHKRLGQNFLIDTNIPRRIAAAVGIGPGERVLEVGVGLGALTRPLAEIAGEVVGVEADAGIVRLHEEQGDLPDNVRLVHADILKLDLAAFCPAGGRLKIAANLPYAISTPFLFRLIEQRDALETAVLMLQKELAERLNAAPCTKEYGAPTVLLAACADVEPLFEVSPAAFHPRPRVHSQVIRIRFFPEPARLADLGPFDRPLFTRIVRAAFSQRRKTLANALSGLFPDRAVLLRQLERAGVAPERRAETLTLAEYARLAQCLECPECQDKASAGSGSSGRV